MADFIKVRAKRSKKKCLVFHQKNIKPEIIVLI